MMEYPQISHGVERYPASTATSRDALFISVSLPVLIRIRFELLGGQKQPAQTPHLTSRTCTIRLNDKVSMSLAGHDRTIVSSSQLKRVAGMELVSASPQGTSCHCMMVGASIRLQNVPTELSSEQSLLHSWLRDMGSTAQAS